MRPGWLRYGWLRPGYGLFGCLTCVPVTDCLVAWSAPVAVWNPSVPSLPIPFTLPVRRDNIRGEISGARVLKLLISYEIKILKFDFLH